jgi:hypothetical protein
MSRSGLITAAKSLIKGKWLFERDGAFKFNFEHPELMDMKNKGVQKSDSSCANNEHRISKNETKSVQKSDTKKDLMDYIATICTAPKDIVKEIIIDIFKENVFIDKKYGTKLTLRVFKLLEIFLQAYKSKTGVFYPGDEQRLHEIRIAAEMLFRKEAQLLSLNDTAFKIGVYDAVDKYFSESAGNVQWSFEGLAECWEDLLQSIKIFDTEEGLP